MIGVKRLAGAALGVLLLAGPARGPEAAPGRPSAEARTAARFDAVAKDRAQLRLFLRAMPKGGDLHNHLSGAAYAEDFLAWADADGLCVTTGPLPAIVTGPCDAPGKVPAKGLGKTNPALYGRAINSLSMRNYNPGADGALPSGHDQFFSTFGRFGRDRRQPAGPAGGGARLRGRRPGRLCRDLGEPLGHVRPGRPGARTRPGTATWPRPSPRWSPACRP
jgi:adenosine deaminase